MALRNFLGLSSIDESGWGCLLNSRYLFVLFSEKIVGIVTKRKKKPDASIRR